MRFHKMGLICLGSDFEREGGNGKGKGKFSSSGRSSLLTSRARASIAREQARRHRNLDFPTGYAQAAIEQDHRLIVSPYLAGPVSPAGKAMRAEAYTTHDSDSSDTTNTPNSGNILLSHTSSTTPASSAEESTSNENTPSRTTSPRPPRFREVFSISMADLELVSPVDADVFASDLSVTIPRANAATSTSQQPPMLPQIATSAVDDPTHSPSPLAASAKHSTSPSASTSAKNASTQADVLQRSPARHLSLSAGKRPISQPPLTMIEASPKTPSDTGKLIHRKMHFQADLGKNAPQSTATVETEKHEVGADTSKKRDEGKAATRMNTKTDIGKISVRSGTKQGYGQDSIRTAAKSEDGTQLSSVSPTVSNTTQYSSASPVVIKTTQRSGSSSSSDRSTRARADSCPSNETVQPDGSSDEHKKTHPSRASARRAEGLHPLQTTSATVSDDGATGPAVTFTDSQRVDMLTAAITHALDLSDPLASTNTLPSRHRRTASIRQVDMSDSTPPRPPGFISSAFDDLTRHDNSRNLQALLPREATSPSTTTTTHDHASVEPIEVTPPIYNAIDMAVYQWIAPAIITTSRPAAPWATSKRWMCCNCKRNGQDSFTIVEQTTCSNLDCRHRRCHPGCRLLRYT